MKSRWYLANLATYACLTSPLIAMPVNRTERVTSQANVAGDTPVPRSDQNSMTAHLQLLAKAKQGRIDVYFEGDSITRRWGTSDEQSERELAEVIEDR